jgi:long-chain fatty acid transport protein
MKNSKRLLAMAVAAAIAAPMSASATNGMNMEGYGPIATGMGGASMAYDNGTAAMMNNPATLGMMDDGTNRIDVAVGVLGPDVAAEAPAAMGGATATSGGDSYVMPAFGWARRTGQLSYGAGVFAQGGMGTEYDKNSWMAMGTGDDVRSELGVGRLMFPLAYNVNNKLTVGGSIDYVWGGLDMKMAMPVFAGGGPNPGSFGDFSTDFGGSQVLGTAVMTGGLAAGLGGLITDPNTAAVRIDFSDSSDFTQKVDGTGYGSKLGLTYKASQQLTLGAAYHLKTSMSDWEGGATLTVIDGTTGVNEFAGTMKVKDFQWPATIAAGLAFTPDERWLIAADVKVLQWSDVMKDFTMEFRPSAMAGESATITFFQDWDDQTVFNIGGAYMATDALVLRLGANISSNPIPDKFVHPLFPAIVENHYTAGFGYAFDQASDLNFSLTYAPEVSVTNSNTGVGITHSQMNWQLMYSHSF